MTSSITSKFFTAALAASLLAGGGNQVLGQNTFMNLRNGKMAAKPATALSGSQARINALVSKPGNSQDYIMDSFNNWQLQTNSAYTYDSQGRLSQRLYTDPTTNQNLGREKTTYDAKGNEIENLVEMWNGTSWDLIDGSKTQITYNPKGNKTEMIYEFWNSSGSTWVKGEREQTTYDANDQVATITYASWNGLAWSPESRMQVNHTGGIGSNVLIQEYNNGVWEDSYRAQNMTWRVLYEIPSAYVLESFNGAIWEKEEKYAAVYDANGGHVGVYEEWTGTTWSKYSRETETLDNNKNYTGWMEETWNSGTNSWDYDGEERQVLTYSGIDVTQRIFQDSWSTGTTTLVDRNKEVYSNFQTFNISGIKDQLAAAAVNIFPNPATSRISIEIPAYKGNLVASLADVTGKTWMVKSFNTTETTALDLTSLPKGIYMLQLQTEAGTVVKRIVKQ